MFVNEEGLRTLQTTHSPLGSNAVRFSFLADRTKIMLSTPEDDYNEVLRHGGLPTGLNFQRLLFVHIDAQCVASVVG